jgi:hypothetical protein
MAQNEAVFSGQHSAVSQNQKRLTTEDTESTEEGKTVPLVHGKMEQVNADEQERVQQRAEALALKLAQTYEELARLLERNPGVKRQLTEGDAKADKVYQKLKQRLKMADMAPRCQWVRQDGTSCRSPQMKKHIYCFAHVQMAETRTLMLMLPAAEDANAIQVGLMRIQKAVIEDTISTKKAGLLLYSMQLALTNVGQTTFGKAKDEEMVRDTVDEEEAFREKQHPPRRHRGTEEEKGLRRMDADERGLHSAVSQDPPQPQPQPQNQTQNQTFETQRNGGSGGEEDLPRINADERGLENLSNPIEWKPTADMYRTDTREGMEAYEANFLSHLRGAPQSARQSGMTWDEVG